MNLDVRKDGPFFLKALDYTEIAIAFLALFGMTVIIFAHVIARYVFSAPLQWSEEVAKMLTVWAAFGASSYAFRRGAHVGVTALVVRLPKKLGYTIELCSKLFVIAFTIVLIVAGVQICMDQVGLLSIAAKIPMVLPWSCIPIGSTLVLIRLCEQFYHRFIKKDWEEDVG